jgi:hypothetical protein
MNKKNIAFVTLFESAYTFAQISIELTENIDSFFIVPTKQNKKELNSFGIFDDRILDLSITRDQFKKGFYNDKVKKTLAFFEDSRLPILSIIAASRMCNKESLDELEIYMAQILYKIDDFLKRHNIDLVITEPSDIVQLLTQLVCWKREIYFGQISLARYPSNRIILIKDCTEGEFYTFAKPNAFDINDIKLWLKKFRGKSMRPAYFSKITNYRSLFSLAVSFGKRFPKILKELTGFSELNDLRTKTLLTKYLYDLSRKYFKLNNAAIVNEELIKFRKYVVYFLHVQPERSIDVMSPNYINQIEIIKQLRRSLPWNIDLLVKDHPASDGAQSFRFYADLKKIHGVRLISSQVDSRVISINSLAVATVSGTVAYEMALLNKPAIMFSKIFFSQLPSIYLYKTPDLLSDHFRRLLTSEGINYERNDINILKYLKNLHKNSVVSDWDGYYGLVQSKTLLSIAELIRKVILAK